MARERAVREIEIEPSGLVPAAAALGVERHLRQSLVVGHVVLAQVVVVGGAVDRVALGGRHRLVHGVAQQRMAEPEPPAAVAHQDPALGQAAQPDAGVEL